MTDVKAKEIKINRINPSNVAPIHINDMAISHDGKEFYVQFLEIEPPMLTNEEDVNKLESVDSIIKVKIVFSPEFAEAFAKALVEGIEKFKQTRKILK